MIHFLKKGLVTILAMFVGAAAFAQVTTSSLAGRISDENGEPLAGAAILAVHTPSGTQYGTIANAEGRYVINGMRVGGPYTVTVTFLGFQSQEYNDVTLELAETYSLNASLKELTEQLNSAVVVASTPSKFAVEKTGAATNISNWQITELPTISRTITDVTKLSPYGTNGVMSFAGADGRSSNFTVDGANFNNNFGLNSGLPGGGSPISIDAIEEVQVVISPYDLRQTNFIGGGVNAITKSGTNIFKGSAYVYHRNENLRGDSIDKQQITGARDKDRLTTYGFTLGGPIIKNKLFFFVNAELMKSPTVVNRWRASEDGVANPDNYVSRTTIADMKRVSEFVKQKYGYDTGSYTDYSADNDNKKILARIDWNINNNNHLALRYNYTKNRKWSPTNASSMDGGSRSPYARMSQYSMAFANSMYSQDNLVHSFSLDLNSRISDKLSNQLLATYSKLDDVRDSNSSEFPFIDILDGTGGNYAYMSLGYELFTWNNAIHNKVFNVKDDLTYYAGKHTITGGVKYEYQMADNQYMRNGTGYYRYASVDDFLNGATPEVVNLTYGYNGEKDPAARVQMNTVGLYLQDEWQATDKFKLTYGVRLDGLFFDNGDLMTNNAIKELDYNGVHIDTGKWPDTNVAISPRFGFVYDVFGNKTLKIRGGSGLFLGRLPLVFFTNMPSNSGMIQFQAICNEKNAEKRNFSMSEFNGGLVTDANGKATAKALLDKLASLGYPTTITPEEGAVPDAISAVDKHFKLPQVWKSSLAIDYRFPTSFPMSLTVEGIINKSINQTILKDISIKPVDGFATFNGPDNRHIYPSDSRYTYPNSNKSLPPVYMLKNTHKGYGWTFSVQYHVRPFKNLDIDAAYTHTVSKELTGMPGANASSVLNYMATVEGPNQPGLHNSQYTTPDRLFVNMTLSDKSNNHYSIFYEAIRGYYNYSYIYVNNINGDSYNYDAIYIPRTKDEIQFVSQDDADRFWNYLEDDHYLRNHKGEYAEAYSVYSPWVHKVDLRYAHDFKLKIGNSTNTLQLNFTISNLLNIFKDSWGVAKYMNPDLNGGQILKYEGVNAEGVPTFSTPSAIQPGVKTWTYNHALGQCWYAQIGIKYMFN